MSALATLIAAAALLPGFHQVAAGPHGGLIETGTFPGETRPGLVYLPPGFTRSRTYPVVYLLHGMPGSPSEYVSGTDLAGFADSGIVSGAIPPFLAVLPAAGPANRYNGEWAGPIATALVDEIVPWVDANLPTIATPRARVIAGLSAGGFGAVDIGLHHLDVFGTIESWSGYFRPLHDGWLEHASLQTLAANDPTKLAPALGATLRRDRTRFFLSSGPAHSHWFKPAQTSAFAHELRGVGVPVSYHFYSQTHGEWRSQVDTGLAWALRLAP
ncbi:MAG TPA: alpha/beta hydrolase-fold protein [Gaiellaceae bacterium]|nr:alpha/beta hydrolase-fold protein [Gaiellaceae bacterium]